jgi:hypothetical protein
MFDLFFIAVVMVIGSPLLRPAIAKKRAASLLRNPGI